MKDFRFDHETHAYTLNGERLPSVTQIIKAILPQWEASEWHMQRGVATHRACELLDNGTLDWASVDPEIEPRVKAWQKFRSEFGGEIVANEMRLCSPTRRYAGTLDRIIRRGREIIVCDLKNSVTPQVILQLAAYSLLWTEETGKVCTSAVAVELREDGSYECTWMSKQELRIAERQWLALLTVYGFADEHELLKGKQ